MGLCVHALRGDCRYLLESAQATVRARAAVDYGLLLGAAFSSRGHECAYQRDKVLLVLLEKSWIAGGHVKGREQGVFVRERIPAERDDIEEEPLGCYQR